MKLFKGKVEKIIDKKTIKASIVSQKKHRLYHKKYPDTKKYLVNNPENINLEIGEIINFKACKPVSKLKKWEIEKNK